MIRAAVLLLLVITLSACMFGGGDDDIIVPTIAQDEPIKTAIVLTENAPPTQFSTIGFNPIDYNTDKLPGFYAEISVNFDGQFADSGEPATGVLLMKMWENGVMRTRRVTMKFDGTALSGGISELEAVRIGNDFYLLDKSSGVCTQNSETARDIANLSAGPIVGGITLAVPTGIQDTINEYPAFQYGFAADTLTTSIFAEPPTIMNIVGGEAWLLPDFAIIGRFGVELQVQNARILFGDRPVTGTLRYTYNVYELYTGTEAMPDITNITVPTGC